MIGKQVAHYSIVEKLGEGGMGVVYKARDTHLDRFVAIKVLPPGKVADPERKRRFVQEAKAASALNHPNIIHVYDISSDDGVDYIAMEYVSGKTLEQLIPRKGMRLNDALKIAVQIADALSRAHGAGIVHRDLKPANIMVTKDGLVKVLDFGLAKLSQPEAQCEELTVTLKHSPQTEEGTIVGTVAYMSPEQAQGKPVDARSDIFSFGSVLYEMITAQRPFEGGTKMSTLAAILNREPRSIAEIMATVPRDVERIVARCLRKDPSRRIQTMLDLKVALEDLKEESDSGNWASGVHPAAVTPRLRAVPAIAGAVILIGLAAGGFWLWRSGSRAPPPGLVLTRLTNDSGLTTDPALSSDGKLLAFASDRGGEANLDLWVRQLPGGKPVRLTWHAADDREPSFSPDGQTIAFRSDREGGGVYTTSILAREGDERLIAPQGRRPRFSPDGSQIAYTVGHGGGLLAQAGTGRIFLAPATGGAPRQFRADFSSAAHPVWSPDGKRILFLGLRDAKTSGEVDWWVAPLDGGAPVKTGALPALRNQGFTATISIASEWLGDGNRILFSVILGDSTNLWQVSIDPGTWQVLAPAERLTSGAGLEVHPSAIAGVALGTGSSRDKTRRGTRLAFAGLEENLDIWSLPIEPNQAQVTGEIERLTRDPSSEFMPAVSADGATLAYGSVRSGQSDVLWKDLKTGKETALTTGPLYAAPAAISASGSRMAFALFEDPKLPIYAASTSHGSSAGLEKLCDDCGIPIQWSPDENRILCARRGGTKLFWLEVSSHRQSEAAALPMPSGRLRLSPDDRWLVFGARLGAGLSKLVVARASEAGKPTEPIPLTDGRSFDLAPEWAPNGNLVYFLSDRDGFRCLWAMRLNPASKQPIDVPFAVAHFHAARRSAMNVQARYLNLSVGRDKAVFVLSERTGNIWMAELETR